jgi:hypothetical protein
MPTQSALYARSSTSASTVSSRSADVISTERSRSSSSTTTANATTKALITSSSMAHQRGSVLAGFAGGSVLADFLTTTRVRPDNVRARELIRRLGSLMGHCAIARSQSPTAWKVGSRRGVFGLTSDRPSSCLSATTDKTPIFGFVKRTCRLMSYSRLRHLYDRCSQEVHHLQTRRERRRSGIPTHSIPPTPLWKFRTIATWLCILVPRRCGPSTDEWPQNST